MQKEKGKNSSDLQCWSEIIEKNAKNGVVLEATSNWKLF